MPTDHIQRFIACNRLLAKLAIFIVVFPWIVVASIITAILNLF